MILAEDLRQAVLQAALQGKLTEQLETDSNVDGVLESIQKDKEMRTVNREIKKDKRLIKTIIDKEEAPFAIPENWKWTTLGSIVYKLTDGTHKTPKYTTDGIKFVSVKNMSAGVLDLSETKYISQEEHDELYKRCNPEKGDMLLSKIGTTGVPAIVNTNEKFSLFVSVALLKYCHQFINESFLYYLLLSSLVQEQARANTRGVGNKNWVLDFIAKTMIPFPPIEEQQRIVYKINELMPKIDEYEKIEKELETLKKEFPTDIKDALLQAAMQGKLTEQLASDSSVDELLELIKKEKEELITQKKIKKEKLLPDIEKDEIPFEIPDSWRWERLGNIGTLTRGNGIKRNEVTETGFPCIRYGELYTTYKTEFAIAVSHISKDLFDKSQKVNRNDILMALTGENNFDIALALAYMGDETIAMGGDLTKWSHHHMNPLYLVYVMNSSYAIHKKSEMAKGNIIVHISNDKLATILIPIPPIEEQQRIVERLKKLFPLCEQLIEV